jgi:hypothetical protein
LVGTVINGQAAVIETATMTLRLTNQNRITLR